MGFGGLSRNPFGGLTLLRGTGFGFPVLGGGIMSSCF